MSVELTRLENGLTVVTDTVPHLESATLGIWVDCGSRHETPELMGVSHMLEHMAFKGTKRRTAKEIAVEIEAVGGDLNAYTGREQTAFYARVLRNDVPLALDILSDILLNPVFDEAELARERHVVLQEIGQARDTPDDIVFDHLQSVCFPDQPIGCPILGTEQTVKSFARGDLADYMSSNYRAGGMRLVAAGAVEHAQLVALAGEAFGGLKRGDAPESSQARYSGGDLRQPDDLEQAHVTFAFPGVTATDPDLYAAHVFVTALGGGMSSRLFQEAREKRGLCYSIYAFADRYRDGGVIGIYAGTGEKEAAELGALVAGEIAALAQSATEEETNRARAQIKAAMLMGLESPSARCDRLASQLHAFGRIIPIEDVIARIEAVDADVLRRFAGRVMAQATPAIAALGPVSRLEPHDAFAARFGGAAVA